MGERSDAPDDRLARAVDHAAHLLPAQGPITVFIHHNTLHAFEHLTFDEAVAQAARVFGCQPYLSEERYRAELRRGRIRFDGLRAVLRDDLGGRADESVVGLASRLELRLAMLRFTVWTGPAAELDWFLAETDALRRCRPDVSAADRGRLVSETRRWVMRDLRGRAEGAGLFEGFRVGGIETWDEAAWEAFALTALWRVCGAGLRGVPAAPVPPAGPRRHRDLLLGATGADTDSLVHDVLTRFCAAFLDQGVSHWPLPDRERGLYHAFLALYGRPGGPPDLWLKALAAEAARVRDANVGPLESVRQSLAALGVAEDEWDDFLSATLLALRGWGGMVREVEIRADRVAVPIPKGSLVEFLAVRLLLDRLALAHVAKAELGYAGELAALRDALKARVPAAAPPTAGQRAMPVFQLAQVLGWSPDELNRLTPAAWAELAAEVEAFGEIERRRVFHLAYERRFTIQTLDALALHPRQARTTTPRFQLITCLDEREESFRRHVEEVAPDAQTFGAAGFFALAMYYRGATEAHFVPLCPIVLTPAHWVEEQAEEQLEGAHRRLRRTQQVLGAAAHQAHVGTRSMALGAVLTGSFGVLAGIPLVARTLFPRLTARFRDRVAGYVQRAPKTRLRLERNPAATPGPENGNLGFTLDEMVDIGERLLRDVGLISGFARLVFTVGHGSSSMNNPHRSAYDCGACGGSPGAPNGRGVATVLNDPRVRRGLAARGIHVPEETWFVGGVHNTCNDRVTLFDLDRVPDGHRGELNRVRDEIDQACDRNAHERCRRFMSARLDLTFEEARRHVEGRSEDLAQTRPELGHATNAIVHVGRRERTRGLYFDRRAFLTSYDPTQDNATGDVLARTMGAIFPVCGGINLEYYFSHVDPAGYGCGTKLPHNVTALLGVMDGAQSDLRTGLPWQMTEIHEPVRLLIVCETTPAVMDHILANNPLGRALTANGWVRVAVQAPDTNELRVYKAGAWVPYEPQADHLPRAATSADWYRGWRDHLEFAEIGPAVG
ncbi:DUF2309 domain-containing protein [Urbifossiella limnaea]|uniref:Probable inorganic carbon transporter subunit DabA n=1 Tax=Urbifossiella limnaea TaxID=2528023 RepID=A0A517XLF9_9BACT|nr:DUF2309 domain-containing protein [Urbifossiella limnaea]QDU18338.1 hypothetical protein ETAA1_02230 [Urbifossiella limnaea]